MKVVICAFAMVLGTSVALEAVCKKCEEIREYNRQHPENNYEYYEDYLKDQEKKKQQVEKEPQKVANSLF